MSSWTFTVNNYGDYRPRYDPSKIDYVVYGYEVAPTTGTPHLQGYIRWHTKARMATISKWLDGRAFVTRSKGSEKENRDYCVKGGVFDEFGTYDENRNIQGHRTDLDEVMDKVRRGCTLRDLASDCPMYVIRYHNGLKVLMKELRPLVPLFRNVLVYYVWGPTGVGKTTRVLNAIPMAYRISGHVDHPWDSYSGQKELIMDEWTSSHWGLKEMNNILDRVRFELPCRYQNQDAAWTVVVMVSNDPFDVAYLGQPGRDQFIRRVHSVHEVRGFDDVTPPLEIKCDP